MRNGEDWGGRLNTDGTWTLPNGSIVGGGLDAAYMQTGGDSVLSLGVEGSYTVPGFGTVGGSAGYDRVEAGDMVAERYTADGYAAGYGGRIEAGVTHTSVTTPDGSTSEWDTREVSRFQCSATSWATQMELRCRPQWWPPPCQYQPNQRRRPRRAAADRRAFLTSPRRWRAARFSSS